MNFYKKKNTFRILQKKNKQKNWSQNIFGVFLVCANFWNFGSNSVRSKMFSKKRSQIQFSAQKNNVFFGHENSVVKNETFLNAEVFFHDLKQDIPTEVEMFKLVVVSATCSIAELN